MSEKMLTRTVLALGIILLLCTGCSVSRHPMRTTVKRLQKERPSDDSSFIYELPFPKNKTYRVIQGYFSRYTHRERAALDFNLKKGDTITAARGGVVIRVKQDGRRGGLNRKYRKEGNHIILEHDDGSRAGYWHLQYQGALVEPGDTIGTGHPIARSGKTGYALTPHLHFLVWKYEKGIWQQVPTPFRTHRGIRYLRSWKRYRRPKSI